MLISVMLVKKKQDLTIKQKKKRKVMFGCE